MCTEASPLREGKIRRLIVNLPPRHLKSLMASIAFPLFGLVEGLCGGAFVIFDSGCRGCLLCCERCRIQFAVTLLDPSRADMALYRHADMVRAIAGTCRVTFLSGLAGSQGEDALAEARCAGFASR
jgi:hypothetical protein